MEDQSVKGCGLESCHCLTLLAAIHPQGVFRDFPYLDNGGLNEEGLTHQTSRLQRQYEEVVNTYQQLITQTLVTVRQKRVEPQALVDFLEKIEATREHSDPPVRRQSLYHQVMDKLRAAQTIEQVFIAAHPYLSAFTYHVLTDILVEYGDKPSSKYTVHRYVEKFNFFNQRPIVQAPRIFSPPQKHGGAFLLFYVDWDPSQRTVHELESFRLVISTVFRLTHYTMMLIGVEMQDGVMLQIYQIPATLRELVFPLDERKMIMLNARRVLKVECCGRSEVTTVGKEFYERQLEKQDHSSIDDNFVTPPSSPPATHKTTPPFRITTDVKGYQLESSESNITEYHLQLADPAFNGKNYVALVPNPSENCLLMAIMLCQHVSVKYSPEVFPKIVILANTYRRAQQIFEELKQLLPEAVIHCFTGADDASINSKLSLDKTTTIVSTTGKFFTDLKSYAVSFRSITLLLIDGCDSVHHETSLEDLMQVYVKAKGDETLGKKIPQIVGFTSRPNAGIFALTQKVMVDHLVSLCGLNEATSGLLLTDKVRSQVFLDKEPRVLTEVNTIYRRYPWQDCIAMLCTEMERIEHELDIVYVLERWSEHYMEFVQEKRAILSQEPSDLAKRSTLFDLLPIYSRGVALCKRDGPEGLVTYLSENRPRNEGNDIAVAQVVETYDRVRREVDDIIKLGAPVERVVADVLSKKFTENNEWRGVLFVDSDKQARLTLDEVLNNVHHARPSFLSGFYFSLTSKLTKKKKDREVIEAFQKEDSRLIITPFALEKCRDISEIDLPTCNFIVRLQAQSNNLTKNMNESEYVLTFVSCQERKTCSELCEALQTSLLEKAIDNMPTGEEFRSKMVWQQKLAIREYVNRGNRIKRALTPRKKKPPKGKRVPLIHQFQLRCKKCHIYACHGNQLNTLFIDGARNYVVPYHEFRSRYTAKRFHPKRKVPKQISRLQKIHCSNCNSDWGHVCYFPKRGIELPVLRSHHFMFEINNQLHRIRMWSDALFYVPALSAQMEYVDGDSDIE